jgi:hypothetical protein
MSGDGAPAGLGAAWADDGVLPDADRIGFEAARRGRHSTGLFPKPGTVRS